jgi:hypothetical protein
MFEPAIAQLIASAEMCETNAPIHAKEGNAEQAECSAANARSYRTAIDFLSRAHHDTRTFALNIAVATAPTRTRDHHDVLKAAHAYEQFITRA